MRHALGPLLSIDVTDRTSATHDVDDVLSSFIGGRGVATRLAYERVPFDADPLGADNRLYLSTGPMQYATTSFTGRMNATAVSPLTGGLASSNAGGFMSRNFTATGHSVVEIQGASDELLAVHVTDEGVEVEAVPELEGATVPDVTAHVESERDLGPEHIACIGPAGEREVRFASLMTSESRAFGRGGLGAVLGAKNVKAITVDGDADAPEVSFPDVASDIHREAATSDSIMKSQGTTSVTTLANTVEGMPSYYWSERQFDGIDGIDGDVVEAKKYERGTCSQCAFACKLPTRDEATGLETEGPEFETVFAFGSNSGIDDIVDVMQSNELCDVYGLDTISCGNTIAAYLAAEDEFGNADLIHDLVEKIARREGVGDTLAEGIARCHDDLGVTDYTVKNLDFAAHEGRTLHGQGLAYAVANRGGDHMYSTFYAWEYPLVDSEEAFPKSGLEDKAPAVAKQENARALEDCGIVCRFSRNTMTPERFENLFDADHEDLLEVGARVVELERAFNNRRGFTTADDDLPYREYIEGDLDAAIQEYYDVRGWTEDGVVPNLGEPVGDAAPTAD
ncbi:MAG: aldehyde ferredoxin oxidoreductase C-terminal domain-containing protein [Haloarculaceae archaeon]